VTSMNRGFGRVLERRHRGYQRLVNVIVRRTKSRSWERAPVNGELRLGIKDHVGMTIRLTGVSGEEKSYARKSSC
jgi:hypothetical protein